MFDMGPYYLTAMINLCGGISSVMSASKKSFDRRVISSQPFFGTPINVNVNTYVAGTVKYASGAIGTLFTIAARIGLCEEFMTSGNQIMIPRRYHPDDLVPILVSYGFPVIGDAP